MDAIPESPRNPEAAADATISDLGVPFSGPPIALTTSPTKRSEQLDGMIFSIRNPFLFSVIRMRLSPVSVCWVWENRPNLSLARMTASSVVSSFFSEHEIIRASMTGAFVAIRNDDHPRQHPSAMQDSAAAMVTLSRSVMRNHSFFAGLVRMI
jgi:hypothetical protein